MYAQAPLQPSPDEMKKPMKRRTAMRPPSSIPRNFCVVDAVEEGVVVGGIGAGDTHGWS